MVEQSGSVLAECVRSVGLFLDKRTAMSGGATTQAGIRIHANLVRTTLQEVIIILLLIPVMERRFTGQHGTRTRGRKARSKGTYGTTGIKCITYRVMGNCKLMN